MRRFLVVLLFAGCLQAESLADFTGLCFGATERIGSDSASFTGFCHVTTTEREMRIEMSVRGPVQENINILTGVKVFYRDDKGIAPPVMHVETTDVCTFTVLPQDPGVHMDLVRYVAEHGNPFTREAVMRLIVEPTAEDTPDTHKLLVRFVADRPIWHY